jgi:hypothetical protein
VDVQVRHGFAGVRAVVSDEAESFDKLEFFGDGACHEQEVAKEGLVGGGGLADARDGFFGDDEQVDGRGGLDVVDDNAVLVLVLDAGGNFAGDNALEKGGHGERIKRKDAKRQKRNKAEQKK